MINLALDFVCAKKRTSATKPRDRSRSEIEYIGPFASRQANTPAQQCPSNVGQVVQPAPIVVRASTDIEAVNSISCIATALRYLGRVINPPVSASVTVEA
jgi:hypothetical protein